MPLYQLSDTPLFPNPELAEEEGLLAIGGDLSLERLLAAYNSGIFPWYSKGQPILWWSPDPRMVLFPHEFHISRSMRKIINKQHFKITADRAFTEVINNCAKIKRKHEKGTWITKEMQEAYTELHKAGYAHSIEAWQNDRLVGGLYGVSTGRAFFGESMFSKVSNASKTAYLTLAKQTMEWGFLMIDCQFHTEHLETLGAREISRTHYLELLNDSNKTESIVGSWTELFKPDIARI